MPVLDNAKRERFCREFVLDHNGTQAAIRAGYSKQTAAAQASRLLTDVNVQLRVKELDQKVTHNLEITHEMIIAEYAKLAFFNPKKLFDQAGKLMPVNKLDDATAAAVSSFEMDAEFAPKPKKKKKKKTDDPDDDDMPDLPDQLVVHEYMSKIRFADKKGALDSLAKIKGLFVEKVEHTGAGGKELIPPGSDIETARRVAFLLASGADKLKG